MHPLQRFGSIDRLQQVELQKERFEVGPGEAPFDTADAAGKLQAAGMFDGGLKEALEAAAEVWGAPDVGFRVRLGAARHGPFRPLGRGR